MRSALFIGAALLAGAAAAQGQTAPQAPEQPPQVRDTTRLPADEDLVRRVQSTLRDKALLDADPDGIFGARTRAALIEYQRRFGLEPTGEIDVQTIRFIDHLGIQRAPTIPDGRRRARGQPSDSNTSTDQRPTQGLRTPQSTTGQTGGARQPSATSGQTGTSGRLTPPTPSSSGPTSVGRGPAAPALPPAGTSGISGAISGSNPGTSGTSGTSSTGRSSR